MFAAALIGVTTLNGCNEEEPEDFGTVRIEISPLSGKVEMFNGTTEIVATVNYEGCLREFYLDRKPTFQQDGPDGAAVFEDWANRLCSDFDSILECEVTKIEQKLIEVNQVYSLSVTLKVLDPSTIAYREVHVGPLPVEEFAGCTDGTRPRVELDGGGLVGKNAQGTIIWGISLLPGQSVAVANQGAPLRVEVKSLIPTP